MAKGQEGKGKKNKPKLSTEEKLKRKKEKKLKNCPWSRHSSLLEGDSGGGCCALRAADGYCPSCGRRAS